MPTRLLIFFASFFCSASIFGQRVIDVDKYDGSALNFFKTVGGEPLMNTKFVRVVEGTPYFTDRWLKGNVRIEESEYRNILLRVNIFETSLEFMDGKGEAMVCTMPIKQVILKDSVNGAQYHFIHSSFLPETSEFKQCWLLELVSGGTSLYRLEKKTINEYRPYGSATTEQRIVNTYNYFVLVNNELIRIKRTSDIPELLVSKKTMLLDYIKSNKLNAKDEKDMARLINYYNTL